MHAGGRSGFLRKRFVCNLATVEFCHSLPGLEIVGPTVEYIRKVSALWRTSSGRIPKKAIMRRLENEPKSPVNMD